MSSTTLNGASEVFTSTAGVNGNPAPSNTQQSTSTSPEEIGWYFVESYYTTLNKTPDRLHLFYQKRSSFIWGLEGDNVPVSQGRSEISERIKQLSFKDCKVRVTNVDSQGSLNSGIIVQVLGDMTNNSEPIQRFSQTFFLAEQTNPQGYYVLNDIFRYLRDEEEEEGGEVGPEEVADAPVESAPEPEAVVVEEKEPEPEKVEEPAVVEDTPVVEEAETKEEVVEEPEKVEEQPVEPEPEKAEEPAAVAPVAPAVPVVPAVPVIPTPPTDTTEQEAAPEATPSVTEPVKETTTAPPPPQVPQEPPKPAKPTSWAALLSKSTPSAPSAPTTAQPVAPVANTANVAPVTAQPAASPNPPPTQTSAQANNSGWQTTESRRQNRPVSMSGPPQSQGSAYVKGVTEKVTQQQLLETLSKFGTVKSIDINSEKKCAFVEFADGAALLAAAKENPHRINGQLVYVEERRPRPGNYGNPRGGAAPRGGDRQGSRGGAQRGPGDRDRFDTNRNSMGGGRGQGGNVRGGGQYPRGGRGGAGTSSSN